MGGEVLAILVIVAVMTAATKSGRNFIRSAHQATGWRTPRKAVQHHSGRMGTLTGRGIAAGTRGSGKAAKFAGRGAVSRIGRLGKNRRPLIPLMWRGDPRDAEGSDSSGSAPQAAGATKPGAPAKAPAASSGPENSGTGTGPAPDSSPTGKETDQMPMTIEGNANSLPTSGYRGSAGSISTQRRSGMSSRYQINLERPATDGEFLESCTHLADVLKSLAAAVTEWSSDLGSLNLPKSVTNPLALVGEGIKEAADGAKQSAKAFEDEFEDARDVAARGMKITGQDAA